MAIKKGHNNQGFNIVHILLVLGIAGVAGFIGWYVWQQSSESSGSSEEICTQSYPARCTKNGKSYLKY
ncbi:hypothetical protein A3A68_01665 [Candidatus Saccharibacteria bacterium RIFCSPLOWO2_01_FULL_48_13]|nr:MAG: hypothetical protein A2884_01885 [Candidatus Saccharibacteria bacterium RIFCSPHIGHO2_01_FULL_48_12]OGL35915.1 MAG: hypothetical protein A3F38_00235 [Candidatus Saccharibacteria bacterium RIFCSPHIGHO2_12_FULL_48_21]OGL37454.1 MAG: hypothetical protein A3A68_01665 [Candidatus Saccharibacteria bacterium RIFCSPLOWO2_01_FULL_48_13]